MRVEVCDLLPGGYIPDLDVRVSATGKSEVSGIWREPHGAVGERSGNGRSQISYFVKKF
jgi:hypothetical protein